MYFSPYLTNLNPSPNKYKTLWGIRSKISKKIQQITFISKIDIEVVTCEFLLTQLLESFIVEKRHRSNHMCYKFIYYHIYFKKKM